MSHGVQNKVLEAVAAGLPVVTTTPVLEGLPVRGVPACRVADAAETFAREILRLLDLTPEQRRATRRACRRSRLRLACDSVGTGGHRQGRSARGPEAADAGTP